MRITSLQLAMADRSRAENLALVLQRLDTVPACDLVLLPEVWPVGFFGFDRYLAEAEPVTGPLVSALCDWAVARRCYLHLGSFIEQDGKTYYNTSLLVDPSGQVIGRYRKIHLFGYQSMERQLLTAGQEVTVVDTELGKLGMATCYDLRFPELFRRLVDRGACLFLVTSAWPMARLEAWQLFNRVRAHENLAFLASCNCAGSNRGIPYAGHSMIVGPGGAVLAEAEETETLLSADIDLGEAAKLREEFPALADRVFF